MSTPTILALALNIQAALQAIATTAGYNYTVKPTSVVLTPTALLAKPPTELPFIVVANRLEGVSRSFVTTRPVAIKERRRFNLEIAIDAPGLQPDVKLTALELFEADVETALCVDLQRGGLALYTYVMPATYFIGLENETRVLMELPVEVEFRRLYGSP